MRREVSKNSQTEPPSHTAQQLAQRRRLCEIVSAKGTPTGDTLAELRRLQDALTGVFDEDGWKSSGIMLRYPIGGLEMNKERDDYVTLKWGTLKSWHITSEEGMSILEKYFELGSNTSAIMVKDTHEQKNLLCQLIDIVPGEIYLEWQGKHVSKQDAKDYVMQYGKKKEQSV